MVCNSGTCTLDIADWATQLCTTTIKVEKSQKVSSFLSCVLILQTRKLSKFKKIHFWCPIVSNFPAWNMVSFASKPNQKKLRERAQTFKLLESGSGTPLEVKLAKQLSCLDFMKQSAEVTALSCLCCGWHCVCLPCKKSTLATLWMFVCLKMDKKRKYLLRFGPFY